MLKVKNSNKPAYLRVFPQHNVTLNYTTHNLMSKMYRMPNNKGNSNIILMKSHHDDHDLIIDPIVEDYRVLIVKPPNVIAIPGKNHRFRNNTRTFIIFCQHNLASQKYNNNKLRRTIFKVTLLERNCDC